MKKKIGPIIAVLVFIIVIVCGYFLGVYIAKEYNEKHNTNKNIFQILKVEISNIPINYVLEKGPKNIKELCGKDTGICDKSVGRVVLNNVESKLHLYVNFDNPNDEATTYFKLNKTKIGSFIYLDNFAILNNDYLVVTETNSYNNNYKIHIYDYKGKELVSYNGTNIAKKFEIKDNNLYFYYCNPADSQNIEGNSLPKVSYFKVNPDDVTNKKEVSFEYKACT